MFATSKILQVFGQKDHQPGSLQNLRCLAGLPILKDWMMIMDLGTKATK